MFSLVSFMSVFRSIGPPFLGGKGGMYIMLSCPIIELSLKGAVLSRDGVKRWLAKWYNRGSFDNSGELE